MSLTVTPAQIVDRAESSGHPGLLARSPKWPRVRLGELLRIVNGAPFPSAQFNAEGRGWPLVRIRDVGARNTGTYFDGQFEDLHVIRRGDLLVGMDGDFRLARWRGSPALLNQRVCRLDVMNDAVLASWVEHVVPGYLEAIGRETSSITVKHLSSRTIADIPIPLPSIEEQRRIVDILEDHLSRLDASNSALTTAQARLRALRLSELRRIRERGEDDAAPLRAVGQIAETSLGKMLDSKRSVGTPTPYLRNINVRWGSIDLSDVRTVPLNASERAAFALAPGDLLVCEGGEPGRCAIWGESGPALMTYQKALHRVRVRPDANVSVEFMALMLEEFIRSGRGERLFTGTTIRHLPQEKLRGVAFAIPALEEQYSAVQQVATVSAAATRLSDALASASHGANALRRALLQAAFTGKLTGRSTDLDRAQESIA
jgi:type I restriction enzyme S subunit